MEGNSRRDQAVMTVDEGEEIAGMWATPRITGIGVYKLIAKTKVDGTCEWAHFVQRDNGLKEKVYRGTVEGPMRLIEVVESINAALRKVYGPAVALHLADADVSTLDGTKDSGSEH